MVRALRIVVPANAGSGWDQAGRALGDALVATGAVGGVSYENVGGKAGTLGLAHYVDKYSADPQALLMGGMVMVGGIALEKPAVNMSQIQPVARLTNSYELIVVRADSPMRTPRDLVAQLREQPAGTVIAGGSAGGIDHMLAGLLARTAGRVSELNYQPHAGGAQVAEAVETGKARVGISGYSELSAALRSGSLRPIGASSKQPFMGIPSMREQGVDVDLSNWRGVFTGGKVGPGDRDRLLAAVRLACAGASWRKAMQDNRWESAWMEGRDLEGFIELDSAMAGVIVSILKLKGG